MARDLGVKLSLAKIDLVPSRTGLVVEARKGRSRASTDKRREEGKGRVNGEDRTPTRTNALLRVPLDQLIGAANEMIT